MRKRIVDVFCILRQKKLYFFFFFSSRRRHTRLQGDWSSDVCSSDLLLPQAEQVPSEPYRHGERLKAYITEVRKGTKGPQIVVSRSHPGLLKSMFALEVPEIAEGI